MKKLNQNLSEIFDVEPIKEEQRVEQLPVLIESSDSVEADAEFARKNIRDMLDKGSKAFDDLALVANQSESPRAYEVLATMMKNMSEMNKDLLALQKTKRELAPQSSEAGKGVSIDKAVFVGSTTELLKMIKANK